jgi:hypothetical protein
MYAELPARIISRMKRIDNPGNYRTPIVPGSIDIVRGPHPPSDRRKWAAILIFIPSPQGRMRTTPPNRGGHRLRGRERGKKELHASVSGPYVALRQTPGLPLENSPVPTNRRTPTPGHCAVFRLRISDTWYSEFGAIQYFRGNQVAGQTASPSS